MSEEKNVKPWDLFNKNIERAMPVIAEKRLSICKSCPRFIRLTHQCKECGCLMNLKVKLKDAKCPLNKWSNTMDIIPFDRDLTDEEIENL